MARRLRIFLIFAVSLSFLTGLQLTTATYPFERFSVFFVVVGPRKNFFFVFVIPNFPKFSNIQVL